MNTLKKIPICLAFSNRIQLLQIFVLIESVMQHAGDVVYDIIVLYTSEENKDLTDLLECLSTEKFKITCKNVSDKITPKIAPLLKKNPCFFTFFIPDLFSGYSKVIYLKYSCLVQSDVSSLTSINLKGKGVAVYFDRDSQNIQEDVFILKIDQLKNIIPFLEEKLDVDRELTCISMLNLFYNDSILFLPTKVITPSSFYKRDILDILDIRDWPILSFSEENPLINPISLGADIYWDYVKKSRFYESIILNSFIEKQKMKIKIPDIDFSWNNEQDFMVEVNSYQYKKMYLKELFLSIVTFGETRKVHLGLFSLLNRLYNEFSLKNKKVVVNNDKPS